MKIKLFHHIAYPSWRASIALPKVDRMKDAIRATILHACGQRFSYLSFSVTFVLLGGDKIKEYNNEYRNKDELTDVLSFPDFDFSEHTWEDAFLLNGSKLFYLGDILFSYENIIRDAKDMDWPPADRVLHLIVHSVLHLLGFDHIEEEDRVVMEGMEIDILSGLGLPNPFDRC